VFTLCTLRLNTEIFYVLPTEYIYVVCVVLRTVVISLDCINLTVSF